MTPVIPVIDIFAGPGGLNEGFSSVLDESGNRIFETKASIEMESNAIQTLRLRSAVRRTMQDGKLYPLYRDFMNGTATWELLAQDEKFARALELAMDEVFQIELGEATREESDAIIAARVSSNEPWVLIGGPPCQAYSLAGRARRTSDNLFYEDKKHFLFREYLHIIQKFRPTVFVMENVKGLLSATSAKRSGFNMFEMIHKDLSLDGDYLIRSLIVDDDELKPSDFVIRAEKYGVAQRRHRVILLGIRADSGISVPVLEETPNGPSLGDVILDLPKVRSLVSPRRLDNPEEWAMARNKGRRHADLGALHSAPPSTGSPRAAYRAEDATSALMEWLVDPELDHLTLHEPRAHMPSDLVRYEYLAVKMKRDHERPTVKDLPEGLRPDHQNLKGDTTPFVDRFKVQAADSPSSTVASHISKDGHYYIHPDPDQMRSLTVREAARLQSFPDNYFFCGNRTAQYHQVGNAVPPFLAHQIGRQVAKGLGKL